MQIVIAGMNHRTAPVELRERVAFSPDQARRAAEELLAKPQVKEAVVVSTCNRSEVYSVTASETTEDGLETLLAVFAGFHGLPPGEMERCAYGYRDEDTVRHLFRVAAGLDSMLLGEAEILGQVRDAYRRALENGHTGPVLNRLFQSALEVGKRVRAETDLGMRPMSVAFAAVKLAEQIFGRLRDRQALLLGAGTVSEQVAAHLRDRGIAEIGVANRSQERAEDLACRVGGHAIAWDSLGTHLGRPDILVASVAATEAVLTRAMVEQAMAARGNRAMFVIDLGVPRNVESSAGDLYNLYLYNIDNLSEIVEQNRKAREQEIPRAEALVAEQVTKFQTWQAGMLLRSLTQELREKLQQVREEFLRERRAQMEHLAKEERERFAKLTDQLIEQVLREPLPPESHAEARRRLQEIETLRESLGLAREKP